MYEALLEFPEWESAYDMGDVSRSSTVLVQLAECVSISFLSGHSKFYSMVNLYTRSKNGRITAKMIYISSDLYIMVSQTWYGNTL